MKLKYKLQFLNINWNDNDEPMGPATNALAHLCAFLSELDNIIIEKLFTLLAAHETPQVCDWISLLTVNIISK